MPKRKASLPDLSVPPRPGHVFLDVCLPDGGDSALIDRDARVLMLATESVAFRFHGAPMASASIERRFEVEVNALKATIAQYEQYLKAGDAPERASKRKAR